MATGRDQVVGALAGVLPARFRVLPYFRTVDTPKPGTVVAMVRVDEVTPAPPVWAYQCAVVVLVPETVPGAADAALDEALEDVLHAIDASDVVRWTRAQRATYSDDELPAYEVTVLVRLRPDPIDPDEEP